MNIISWTKGIPGSLLALFVGVSLLLPVYTSDYGIAYCPEYILANVFALLYIGVTAREKGIARRLKMPAVLAVLGLILCFNVISFYLNLRYHHWYLGQINITISLLFFVALHLSDRKAVQERVLRFLLLMIVVTNVIGFIPYFMGNFGVNMLWRNIALIPMTDMFGEKRYSWIYFHKSEYALMLLLFLGLIVTFRDRFPKKWMYWVSVCVMMAGLMLSNTLTSVASSAFIFAGLWADTVRKKPKQIRKRYLLALIPIVLIMICLVAYISTKRNLLSLGSRTVIWPAAVQAVLDHPLGLGRNCGETAFLVPAWNSTVTNGHNLFINTLLQYSIPAGLICVVLFFAVMIASILKNRNFLTVGIWLAVLIPMNMDWCLLLPQWSLFVLLLYFLFFYQAPPAASRTEI